MALSAAEAIYDLNQKWNPHPGQIGPGQALFYRGIKNIYLQFGRGTGKTEFIEYANWRRAIEVPGAECYVFEPFQNQAREILWVSNRLQSFGPENWIDSINNTEMRITLINKSFIKLDGADKVDSRRGIKPKGLVTYDEIKDIKPSFLRAMEPNRAAHDVPAIFAGTPAEFDDNHFNGIMEFAKTDPESAWFHCPSWMNPHQSRKFLERERRRLISIGAEDEWIREYEAIFMLGGNRAIFPQASKYRYPSLAELIPLDLHHWWLIVSADPGSTSVFAVGFYLFNPYQKRLIAVDEIYETKMADMRVRAIRDQIAEKLKVWGGRRTAGEGKWIFDKVKEVRFVYDEAAAWFKNEMDELEPDWWWSPTNKSENGKEEGIGFIRDLFNETRLDIAGDNCPKLKWELQNYAKDDKGKIPKMNDHRIDDLRYAICEAGLDLKETEPTKPPDPDTQRRAYKIDEELNLGMTELGEV